MAISTNGLFVSTTDNYDLTRLKDKDLGSVEFQQFIVKLMSRTNDIALTLNQKDSGIYQGGQFNTGQVLFTAPNVKTSIYRSLTITGQLPNAGTKTVPHGLTFDTNTMAVTIYGAASDTVHLEYISLPFVSVGGKYAAGNIQLDYDATNVYITTTGNGSNFDKSCVILEYIKS